MKNLFIGFVIAIVLAAFFNASERAEESRPEPAKCTGAKC
ncbi:hypothetical protein GCM10009682_64220 [Luedemannella flava]|uniref:Uncharacterized protein n=1 Tax=Luedemannella flava TaxID=349316 RepID=A0ABN2MUK0_9ACTN